MDVLSPITPKIELEKDQKQNLKYKPYTLLISKFNSRNSSNDKIKSEISDYFNSPDKYFDINSHISLNKKINLKKVVPIESLIEKEKTNNKEIFKNIRNNSRLTELSKEKHISTSNFNNNNNKDNNKDNTNQSIKRNFEKIDNEKLKKIFKSYKNNNSIFNIKENSNLLYNKINNNNEYNLIKKSIPRQISMNLNFQDRQLKNKKDVDRKSRIISKYLSRKLHKNESDLLINNVHFYRFKKEILDNDDENNKNNIKIINKQNCLYKWISSLRKPKKFNGKIESYVNVSSENNPLWSIVVEKYPLMKEVSVRSGYNLNSKDFNDFKRKWNLSSINSAKLRNMENLDKINIKGEKLYNVEYNREMSNNNSKILHNVFVDNGKIILYKDVNDLFGNETIYKNYNYHCNESSYINRSLDNMSSPHLNSNLF